MENKRILAYSLITLLSTSCGTTMLAPPNKNFLNLSGTLEPTKSDSLAAMYHRANLALKAGFKKEACPTFEELSLKEDFPLREISTIKAIESCEWTIEKLITTWKELEVSSWLKEEYHRKSLIVSKEKNIRQWESKHNFELSFFPKRKSEKEKFLKMALQIAEEEQLEELITKYNERLQKISPRFIIAAKPEELYSIGRDYERASEYKKAIETYESILRSSELEIKTKMKSWKRITRAFKNMRRKDLAHSSTKRYVKWIETNKELFGSSYDEEVVDARMTWARSSWTQGELKLAKKILNNTIKKKKGSKQQVAHIYYLLANIAKEEKKLKSASYLLSMAEKLSKGSLKEKIMWQRGWIEYKKKNYTESSKVFLALHDEYEDRSKYAYWSAKSLSREKKPNRSVELFNKTVEIAPYGFYGLNAKRKLGLIQEIETTKIEESKDDFYSWLIALGEYELTKKYLDQFIYKSSNLEKIELLEKMNTSGNYPGVLKTYFNMSSDLRDEVQEKHIGYIYPKPTLNSKYLNKRIDINLVYSIIRQESAFDKNARSFADAFGLMQIIPERAKKLARKHRIPYRSHNDLYQVDINTGLGSNYLNDLVKYFKHRPMAIGSYNAGESAMKRWVKSRYDGDVEVFIEDIPYRETKKYIKLVLRNLEIYKSLPIQKDRSIY